LKAVLFDLEGTLVESDYQRTPEIVEGLRRATRDMLIGLGVPEGVLHGLSRSYALRNAAYQWADENPASGGASRLRAEMEAFMDPYDMTSAERASLYPDTLEALESLSGMGVEMGIVTNTSRSAAEHIIEKLGLRKYFTAVATRSEAPRLKPDPAMIHQASSMMEARPLWLVGDTSFDAEAARNAGIRSIVIRRDGTRPGFPHDFFITRLVELRPIFTR